jgi:uncharacterized heparinase superfamily protein
MIWPRRVTVRARGPAQAWVFDWIAAQGTGKGPGWTPDLTGRRLIRWINHALMLLNGRDKAADRMRFCRADPADGLSVAPLAGRGPRPAPVRGADRPDLRRSGADRVGRLVDPALEALARDCRSEVDAEGGIPTRNPEDLLEVFTLLTWAAQALADAGRTSPPDLAQAIERVAPTLRALRHADGGLARFHGGGRGLEGRLDHALAQSGVKPMAVTGLAMGFARLAAGRTTVIIVMPRRRPKAAPRSPPMPRRLAFELTSGRRPVIVSCGSGAPFGPEWRRAGRATASHSTLPSTAIPPAALARANG